MKWSLKLGQVSGIGIYMHWTFLLLIGYVFFVYLSQGQGVPAALRGLGFIMAIFGCVVLHELGHALTAKRYNIKTKDITLLPIGGLARLEKMPDKPIEELWVALAGPAVNVVIAGVLYGILTLMNGIENLSGASIVGGNFLASLMIVNVFLVAFNLLPAFPMDGGRVLRALLAMRMDYRRATGIAASVGQMMAILFGVVGIFYNPFLLFIALFVYLGAQAEAQMGEVNFAIRGLKARDAMMTRFRVLSAEDTLATAVRELLAGSQHDFPVMDGERVAGLLRRNDLVKGLAESGQGCPVQDVMQEDCKVVNSGDPLKKAFETMQQGNCSTVPVLEEGRMVGLLTLENISELVMVDNALHQAEDTRFR